MKIKVEVDMSDFYRGGCGYGEESFDEVIMDTVRDAILSKILDDKHNVDNLANQVAKIMVEGDNSNVKKDIDDAIVAKINRSQISKKVEVLVNKLTSESLNKIITEKYDVEKMIKDEVVKQTLKMLSNK